jgi:hypothetical protein
MKSILVTMTTNSEGFDLPNPIHWESVTLESCNLIFTNGANTGEKLMIHIPQMQQEIVVYQSSVATNLASTFIVGSEPFNPQAVLTIKNSSPNLPLRRLDIKVYKLNGSPATISFTFIMVLNIKECPTTCTHSGR